MQVGPVSGYGYWVGINHGIVNGVNVSSEYGHISKWVVNNGQLVKQGQSTHGTTDSERS